MRLLEWVFGAKREGQIGRLQPPLPGIAGRVGVRGMRGPPPRAFSLSQTRSNAGNLFGESGTQGLVFAGRNDSFGDTLRPRVKCLLGNCECGLSVFRLGVDQELEFSPESA